MAEAPIDEIELITEEILTLIQARTRTYSEPVVNTAIAFALGRWFCLRSDKKWSTLCADVLHDQLKEYIQIFGGKGGHDARL